MYNYMSGNPTNVRTARTNIIILIIIKKIAKL